MKKATFIWVLTLALAIVIPFNAAAAEDVSMKVSSTAQHVQAGEFDFNFDLLAISLLKAGKMTESNKAAYLTVLKNRVNSSELAGPNLHKTILAVRALGLEPTNFEGQDLIKKAYNDTTLNTLTAYVYALIAFDSADYSIPEDAVWTKAKLIDKITNMDSTGGGWNWAGVTTDPADPDTTGMVLTALGKHKSNPVVKSDINNAVSYIKAEETDNAGFISWGNENSNSTAQIVIGLSSIGVDPTSAEFMKNNNNPVNHLFTYETSNGGYKYTMGSEEDSFSNEQVYQALVAYDKFKVGDHLFSFPYQENEDPSLPEAPVPSSPIVNNNNTVYVTPSTDVSKLPVAQSTKETIREIIKNNNTGTAGTAGNAPTQPQVIIVQQPAAAPAVAGEPKVEVKVEKDGGTFNSNNLKVGGTTALIGAIALVLRRKFLGV